MSYCTHCGNEVSGNFCENCGKPVKRPEAEALKPDPVKAASEISKSDSMPAAAHALKGVPMQTSGAYPQIRPVEQPKGHSGFLFGCLVIFLAGIVGILLISGIGFFLFKAAVEGGLDL